MGVVKATQPGSAEQQQHLVHLHRQKQYVLLQHMQPGS